MTGKNLKTFILFFAVFFAAHLFAANPAQPFLPSDNVQDPNCVPSDSNCYVSFSGITNGGNSLGTILTIGTNDNNALQFETNGINRMMIDANGNVGIGTTTPTSTLVVDGTSLFTGAVNIRGGATSSLQLQVVTTATSSAAALRVRAESPITWDADIAYDLLQLQTSGAATGNTGGRIGLRIGHGSTLTRSVGMYAVSESSFSATVGMALYTGGTDYAERLRITNSGRVGIGTSTPAAKLHILSNSTSLSTLVAQATSSQTSALFDLWNANSASVFNVSPSGNVGIGTTTGANNIDVVTPGANGRINITADGSAVFTATAATTTSASLSAIVLARARGTAAAPTALVSNMNFASIFFDGYNGSSYARTSAITVTATETYSTTTQGSSMALQTTLTGSTTRATRLFIDGSGNIGIGTTTPADKLQVIGDIRVGAGATSTDGCIKNFAGTGIVGTCSSDERLKTDIADFATGTLDKVLKLRTVSYKWNDVAKSLNNVNTEVTNYGLLAQNVEQSFPELVITDSNGYKQVNYSVIPLYILKAVQELAKKVSSIFDGTGNIFGSSVTASDKLCVGHTCVTEQQLIQMMQNQNIQNSYSAPATPTPPAQNDTEQGTTTVETAPTLDPTPAPEQTSTE